MKFFLTITLITTLLLLWTKPFVQKLPVTKRVIPSSLLNQKAGFKDSFDKPENANVLWAFMTGEKKGISPITQNDFRALELGFLFSPSGIHISSLLIIIFFFFKNVFRKRTLFFVRFLFLSLCFLLPYLAIKRIVLLKLLIMLKDRLKLKLTIDSLFFLTFFISFLLGHFEQSPLGFILSFLYMGTFISLRDYSKVFILLGLLASHLLICLFSGNEVSPLALLINLPFLGFFAFLMPTTVFYFLSFKWIPINWLEPIIRFFIVSVHLCAKFIHGSTLNASLPFILAIWVILLRKKKRYLVLLLFLHGSLANSPACFFSGSFSQGPAVSADK